jgi:hypothetical protein
LGASVSEPGTAEIVSFGLSNDVVNEPSLEIETETLSIAVIEDAESCSLVVVSVSVAVDAVVVEAVVVDVKVAKDDIIDVAVTVVVKGAGVVGANVGQLRVGVEHEQLPLAVQFCKEDVIDIIHDHECQLTKQFESPTSCKSLCAGGARSNKRNRRIVRISPTCQLCRHWWNGTDQSVAVEAPSVGTKIKHEPTAPKHHTIEQEQTFVQSMTELSLTMNFVTCSCCGTS